MEILGTVSAAASLFEIIARSSERFQKAARELDKVKLARSLSGHEIERLREVYAGIVILFNKYNRDVDSSLQPADKKELRELLMKMSNHVDKCEATVGKLKGAMAKKSKHKDDMEHYRQLLSEQAGMFTIWQQHLLTHLTFEHFRRASEPISPRTPTMELPLRRATTVDMTVSSSSGGSSYASGSKPPDNRDMSRADTFASVMSGQTLVESSSVSPRMARANTSSSIGSNTGSSSSSTPVVRFMQSSRLKSAVEKGQASVIASMLKEFSTAKEATACKSSALLMCCEYGRSQMVEWLLKCDASLDARNDKGHGAMHCTVANEFIDESRAKESVSILKMLVSKGARIQAIEDSVEKRQPLHLCAITGNYFAAGYLLTIKPDIINSPDARGKTALYHACQQPSPSTKLVRMLLERGATFGKKSRPSLKGDVRLNKIRHMLTETEKERPLTTPTSP